MKNLKDLMYAVTAKKDMIKFTAREEVTALVKNEDGDTNFISILVLLGIALALAGVFLAFKDQVLGWVDANIGDFFGSSGGR